MLTVKITDSDKVVAQFGKMNARATVAVSAVVNKAALETQGIARQLAPVDTGRLRSSIRPRFFAAGLAAEVYTDVEYAAHVEFGTRHMAAKPYLFPAFEAVRPLYLAELRAALQSLGRVKV